MPRRAEYTRENDERDLRALMDVRRGVPRRAVMKKHGIFASHLHKISVEAGYVRPKEDK